MNMTNTKASTVNPYITGHLRQLIYYHLDCNSLRNALFFAGRLHAYEPRSSEAAYLIALCHLRIGQPRSAYDYSRNPGSRGTHLGCAYVFAQACLILEKYAEGATALERCRGMWSGRNSWGKHSETRRQHLPDAAAVSCLKGRLWQAYGEHNKAIDCYVEALRANPFMWDAFTGLCDLGVNVQVPNIFKVTAEISDLTTAFPEETATGSLDDMFGPNPLSRSQAGVNLTNQAPTSNDPFSISKNRLNGDVKTSTGTLALFEKLNGARNVVTPILHGRPTNVGDETPVTHGGIMDPDFFTAKNASADGTINSVSLEAPLAPARKPRSAVMAGFDAGMEGPPRMNPSAAIRSKSGSKTDTEEQEVRPSGVTSGLQDLKRTISGKAPASLTTSNRNDSTSAAAEAGAPQRRSVRLFNQIRPQSGRLAASTSTISAKEGRELRKAKAPGVKGRSTNTLNVGRVVSGNRKHADAMDIDSKEQRPPSAGVTLIPQQPIAKPVNHRAKELEGIQSLLDLLTKLGAGYFALSHYRCQEALRCFNSLAVTQRETPWVLAQIGRAYYEQTSYAEAEKIFARLKSLAPSRLEDLEVYSTTLWHLKNEIDLAFLAHETTELDRNSPQAWCAVGNGFSLQRDHDQALKCFKRATQLDPKFAYAYTLQGHEHVSNEEFDKAIQAYRASISADKRHYNAWYGLGRVYERQGKYPLAEQHYRTAASINPTNAVLITCIGVVLEKMKNPRGALLQYSRACDLAEKSTLCRFRKARVLMTLNEPEKSLQELKVLKDVAPDEANVHFLLGKVYKALRRKGDAIRHFTMALNLDPKVCLLIHMPIPKTMRLLKIKFPLMYLYADPCARPHTTSKKPWSRWRTKTMKMTTRACKSSSWGLFSGKTVDRSKMQTLFSKPPPSFSLILSAPARALRRGFNPERLHTSYSLHTSYFQNLLLSSNHIVFSSSWLVFS